MAITPYNPNPQMPRGIEIVSELRRSSPHLLRPDTVQLGRPVSAHPPGSVRPETSSVLPVATGPAVALAAPESATRRKALVGRQPIFYFQFVFVFLES